MDRYRVVTPLMVDGKRIERGQITTLSPEQAAPLKSLNPPAVEILEPPPTPKEGKAGGTRQTASKQRTARKAQPEEPVSEA
ncbi:hypothetical protein GS597_01435 [Synechococcales cyanobacterium C]|uniref:Uncharacterized protein n=1 Tax=Petrachloros mirabilis ULC683 TaxID=2781853 RepID=A0A8K1ZW46_9CYAN|nr:hypothetical protein [Petrachloros mirabilis]NCJ05202.1 hypothetical protein [Petrachloros mirabilis ULC683]